MLAAVSFSACSILHSPQQHALTVTDSPDSLRNSPDNLTDSLTNKPWQSDKHAWESDRPYELQPSQAHKHMLLVDMSSTQTLSLVC